MKDYTVRTYCPDCIGQDPQGCFDGGDDWSYFDTLEEAQEFADKETQDCIWRCEIFKGEPMVLIEEV